MATAAPAVASANKAELLAIADAVAREKQIKGGSRAKKLALIEAMNPEWNDLFPEIAHS